MQRRTRRTAYLKDAAGGDFSAKDFPHLECDCAVRRGAGGASAAWHLADIAQAACEGGCGGGRDVPRQHAGRRARLLHRPRVIDRFEDGLTVAAALAAEHEGLAEDEPVPEQNVSERMRRAVLDLIDGDDDAPGVDEVAALAA